MRSESAILLINGVKPGRQPFTRPDQLMSAARRIACNDLRMSVARHQTLRVLDGSYVLDRRADVTDVDRRADVLAVVFGPDGSPPSPTEWCRHR
jgi:hypothetical protein